MAGLSEPDEATMSTFWCESRQESRHATFLGLQHYITKGAMRLVWGQG